MSVLFEKVVNLLNSSLLSGNLFENYIAAGQIIVYCTTLNIAKFHNVYMCSVLFIHCILGIAEIQNFEILYLNFDRQVQEFNFEKNRYLLTFVLIEKYKPMFLSSCLSQFSKKKT